MAHRVSVQTAKRGPARRNLRWLRHGVAHASASFIALSTVSLAVLGQQPSTRDESDRHFLEAKALLEKGEVAEACERFERSYRALPRNGTLLNLAVCLERRGDHVGAFQRFTEALSAAEADGRRDRVKLAQEHLQSLIQQLAQLVIVVERAPDLLVFCDGAPLEPSSSPTPLLPGTHLLQVTARGRVGFVRELVVTGGTTYVVHVALPIVTETRVASSRLPPTQVSWQPKLKSSPLLASGKPATGFAQQGVWLASLGATSLTLGGIFGTRAILDAKEAARVCPDQRCSTDHQWSLGQRLEERGRNEARVANVAVSLGVLAMIVGAYLFMVSPNEKGATRTARTARTAMLTGRSETRSVTPQLGWTW